MSLALTLLLNGLVYGGLYIAIALGMVLVYRFGDTLNFAHGAVATLAAYTAWESAERGLPYWQSALICLAVATVANAAIGMFVGAFFRGASGLTRSMVTLGIALVIMGLLGMHWGHEIKALAAVPGVSGVLEIAGVKISALAMTTTVISVALVVGIQLVLRFTRVGVSLRTIGENRTVAAVNGLNVARFDLVVWATGGFFAGAAALLITPQTHLDVPFLTNFLITAFTAAVIGGMSSVGRLAGGGFVFGVISALLSYFVSGASISLAGLVILVLVLAFRPEGLFTSSRRASPHEAFDPLSGIRTAPGRLGSLLVRASRPVSAGYGTLTERLAAGPRMARKPVYLVYVALVLATLTAPVWASTGAIFALTTAAALAVAVAGQNVVSGHSGQLSIAQGGFMLFGGYVVGLMALHVTDSALVGLIAAGVAGLLLSVILSAGVVRLTGVYLAIVSLQFCVALTDSANEWDEITGGEAGLTTGTSLMGVQLLGPTTPVFYLYAGVAAVMLIAITLGARSTFGLRWRAVRDSPKGAQASGVDARLARVIAFAAAGVTGGVAGGLLTLQLSMVTPESFGLWMSVYILLASSIGGEDSTILGPVMGAVFIVMLPFVLSESGALSDVLFGTTALVVLTVRESVTRRRRTAARTDVVEYEPVPVTSPVAV